MSGHTPGPWHANAIKGGRIIGGPDAPGAEKIQINSHNATIATVCRAEDATRIAALPDVLNALAICLKALEAARDADAADEDVTELIERSVGEGWDNDPTGSSHVSSASMRASRLREMAVGLRATAITAAIRAATPARDEGAL